MEKVGVVKLLVENEGEEEEEEEEEQKSPIGKGSCTDCVDVNTDLVGPGFGRLTDTVVGFGLKATSLLPSVDRAGEQRQEPMKVVLDTIEVVRIREPRVLKVVTDEPAAFALSRLQRSDGTLAVISTRTTHLILSWQTSIGKKCTVAVGKRMGTTGWPWQLPNVFFGIRLLLF